MRRQAIRRNLAGLTMAQERRRAQAGANVAPGVIPPGPVTGVAAIVTLGAFWGLATLCGLHFMGLL